MPKTPPEMYSAVRTNLPRKTGLTLNEWKMLVTISGPITRKAQVDWLRENYGLGSVQAAVVVAELSGGNGREESERESVTLAHQRIVRPKPGHDLVD